MVSKILYNFASDLNPGVMKKRSFLTIMIAVAGFIGLMDIIGCGSSGAVDDRLNLADELMEERPDSALFILNGIDGSELRGSRMKARYALLKSMALDKNYIDTTTFDVLQPAIDYYFKHGNADEKLRTYYYQGVIYKNTGEDDLAMQSCLMGLDNKAQISDSLTLARILVAQGALFYKQYRIKNFIENNLKAGDIYGKLGKGLLQLRSYSKALDGETRLKNKLRADSLATLCKSIIKAATTFVQQVLNTLIKYDIGFGNINEIKEKICQLNDEDVDCFGINLALAYSKIGEPAVGLQYLHEAKIAPDNILDSLTFWSVKTEILDKLGEDKAALDAFRNYSRVLEKYHIQLFSNELLFSEKKHEMKMDEMERIRRRDRVIKWILIGVGLLMLLTVFIYFRYRMNKAGRIIAEGNAERLKLEGDRQRLLAEKLEAERTQLKLESENLHLQVGQLEGEREQLKELLDKQEILSEEARQLIRERIDMLNGLFAKALTDVDSYGKEFQKYVEKIRKDKKKFQESIRKVLETTHPEFMAYLNRHGLTEREMHYVCLYAIGMRGKEIGNYLDLARHYNISTDIRRKLGLDSNGENLGTFIRKMMTGQGL